LSCRGFPRSIASLIASGKAIAKCGSEAGFTIKTFSATLQLSGIGESWSVDLKRRERRGRAVEEKGDERRSAHICS